VESATWLSCRQLVASDCDLSGLIGPLRRRGDVAPDLVRRIHHVPHRYRGLLQ